METILNKAIANKQKSLSEYESKIVLKSAGLKITKEKLVKTLEEAVKAAEEIGYPVVMKGCSHDLMHKTELGMVKLGLLNEKDVKNAFNDITAVDIKLDGVIVQETINGNREFVIGLNRDPQFGPCVMFGLGGIFTEVLKDATFRVAPLTKEDAIEMIEEIKASKMLNEFRGDVPVDRDAIVEALIGIGDLGVQFDSISEIDVNPIIIAHGKPVAVDGLVIVN